VTFQVAPRFGGNTGLVSEYDGPTAPPGWCDSTLAQTPHRGGMLVAMGDGSVKTVSSSVSVPVYWGAVTPAGGEASSIDA
jgi:hypothetical protein